MTEAHVAISVWFQLSIDEVKARDKCCACVVYIFLYPQVYSVCMTFSVYLRLQTETSDDFKYKVLQLCSKTLYVMNKIPA